MFCPHCGNEISEGHAFCQHCGMKLEQTGIPPSPGPAGGREAPPWEDREREGFFGGLFKTVRQVLFHPAQFFRKMSVTGGLSSPILFALITGMIGLMFSYTWQTLLEGSIQGYLPLEMRASRYQMFEGPNIAVLTLLSPFALILLLYLVAGLLHLLLLMVKGARAGFEATFRVVSYCFSPFLFQAIPICGGLIWFFWTLVIGIIGLKEAHDTSGGKVAFAVLFPLFLCCGAAVLLVLLFMGALAASFGVMQQQ